MRAEALTLWLDAEVKSRDANIVIVHAGEIYSEGLANDLREKMAERGIGVIEMLRYDVTENRIGDEEINDIVDSIRAIGDIDSLVFSGFSSWDSDIIRKLRPSISKNVKVYVIEPNMNKEP